MFDHDKLNFEVEPDLNIREDFEFGNTITKSLGGTEFALNTSGAQRIFTISFQNISQTFKDNLVDFQTQTKGGAVKFLYYTGSEYIWARLGSPLSFSEVADSRYSVSINIREQIQ